MPMEEPMAQVPAPVMAEKAGREDLPTYPHDAITEKKSMEKVDHHAQEAEVREHYYDPLSELHCRVAGVLSRVTHLLTMDMLNVSTLCRPERCLPDRRGDPHAPKSTRPSPVRELPRRLCRIG